jgi:hypothetical protein
MLGGGPYECRRCPKCGCLMWNGRCENKECEYHWHPIEDDEEE